MDVSKTIGTVALSLLSLVGGDEHMQDVIREAKDRHASQTSERLQFTRKYKDMLELYHFDLVKSDNRIDSHVVGYRICDDGSVENEPVGVYQKSPEKKLWIDNDVDGVVDATYEGSSVATYLFQNKDNTELQTCKE